MWTDIAASEVQRQLSNLRKGEDGIGAQTYNFYLQAVKQFCRWMVDDRRAGQSPVAHLKGVNVKTDRRHDRRALELDELQWLLSVTQNSPERGGVSGQERSVVYRLAVESGLRANELRTLNRSSFDFEGELSTVTVDAAYSKSRRQDVLPLRHEMAELLRAHLATKLPQAPAFTMPKKDAWPT